FGIVTRRMRCHHVAPSTFAASCSSPGTCARPDSSRSEMNGVVFQISDSEMTVTAVPNDANQSVSSDTNGSHAFMNPLVRSNMNRNANAETTVMIAYGMRI